MDIFFSFLSFLSLSNNLHSSQKNVYHLSIPVAYGMKKNKCFLKNILKNSFHAINC